MKFYREEIPIAISMIGLAQQANHPFQSYFVYWAAFNNIYVVIGNREGLTVCLDLDNNNPKLDHRWGYTFPKVIVPKEYQKISKAIEKIDNSTKDMLIMHDSISFFIDRIPRGVDTNHDSRGQLINGVLNLTRTANSGFPVWSPINKSAYQNYLSGDLSVQDTLTEQIIFMLYTIRNNLVHGSKDMSDANDIQVVEKAIPLLEIVVRSFISIE